VLRPITYGAVAALPAVVGVFLDEVAEDADEVDVAGHRAGDDRELQPPVATEQAERRLALLIDGRRQLDHTAGRWTESAGSHCW